MYSKLIITQVYIYMYKHGVYDFLNKSMHQDPARSLEIVINCPGNQASIYVWNVTLVF